MLEGSADFRHVIAFLVFSSVHFLCKRVRLAFTCGDQLAQIAAYECAPCVRAAIEAFVFRDQTGVGKTDFRFAVFFRDLKNNLRTVPLALIFNEAELAIQHLPDNSLARNKFRYLLLGTMYIFVAVCELRAEFVGVAFDLS